MGKRISAVNCLVLQLLLTFSLVFGANWTEGRKEEVRPGKCPAYKSQENFVTSKFVGTWYVAHQFQTYKHRRFLECQKLEMTSVPGNDLSLHIKGYVRATSGLGIQTDGESITPDAKAPGFMRWSWDYFPNMIDYVSVLDTDYDNYAVIVLCQDFGLLHTVYPILMTREMPINVTDSYTKYFNRAEKVFPFPVFPGWGDPNTCYFEKAYKDADVSLLNIDETMRDITAFLKKVTN